MDTEPERRVTTLDVTAAGSLDDVAAGILVVPVFADLVWGPGADIVAQRMGEGLERYLRSQEFTGALGQVASTAGGGDLRFDRIVFVGVGAEVDAEALRRAAGNAGRAATAVEAVATTLHQIDLDDAAELVTLGFSLGQYRFDRHQSVPKDVATRRLVLVGDGAGGERGLLLAEAVRMARDLVNEPAGAKSPEQLAGWATETLGDVGAAVEVWEEDRIASEGLGGLQSVAAGSVRPPRLVRVRHRPVGSTRKLVLVGKGIVFDSGGLSIKTADAMTTMKTDMAGAAAVFASMWALARLGLPVEVIGIAPLTENMPGPNALRPGDVFTARNGKTVEVLNTDAEGRLVLADGLSLGAEEAPDLMIDVATLTGAAKVALGERIAAVFASNDVVGETLLAAAAAAGEAAWRLPLEPQYRPKLDSTLADMKNIGDRWGGAITAALMLKEFVGDAPWAHLDVAGPARSDVDEHYVTKGGTGFGVRTLVEVGEILAAG